MITLRTLGPADVRIDGQPAPPELLWRKNLALLVYLARSPHRTRTREHLMGLLWGDRPPSSARHSLREAIRAIRGACGEAALIAEGDNLRLAKDACDLDLDRLEDACRRGAWRDAAALAAGDFLEGFGVSDAVSFEEWLSAERHLVRALLVDALVNESESRARAADLTAATGHARRALMIDPLSATATYALITASALAGERGEALTVFDMYARAFAEATGLEPDARIVHLADRVRRERVPRVTDPTARGAESRRGPLVGRSAELARLAGMLDTVSERPAVLVIDGDAGSGRTRMAEEIASRARLEGATIIQARGTPADRDQPWSGIMALARGGLLSAPGITGAAPEALAAFLGLDDWGDRLPGVRGATPLPAGPAFTGAIRAAAAESTMLIAVDDAHWFDGETLAHLQSLVRDCDGLPVALVLTAASAPAREELDQLRARAGRDFGGGVVQLAPLGMEAIDELSRWAMPAWDADAVARLARRIAADSAGLPLLAVELLHAVALGLDLESSQSAWPAQNRTLDQTMPGDLPESIVAAIRIGFRRLSPNAQLTVAALAVLKEDAGMESLARATGLAPRALADALDEAEWQRWLVADGRGYGFVARITREIVAADMVTKGQRRRFEESLTTA